jgi:hypothetical protein
MASARKSFSRMACSTRPKGEFDDAQQHEEEHAPR